MKEEKRVATPKGIHNQPTEDTTGQDEPSFLDKAAALRDKLKLGSHHKMERFAFLFGATSASLLLLTGVAFTQDRIEMSRVATSAALLTQDFSFSLSGQTGTIQGVYGDPARTDVHILFKLADVSTMSLDAKAYEMYITGHKNDDSISKVSFSLFGATGYGTIRFQNENGIPNEPLNIVLRANTTLASAGSGAGEGADASFDEYDQTRIYVNPGADAVSETALAVGEDDPSVLYTELVAAKAEAEVRERIMKATANLETHLKRADEYKNRLVTAGYKPPATPWFVEGDYIDEAGYLVAAKSVPGAHAIDIANTTLRDGYVKQVTTGLEGYSAYMKEADTAVPKPGDPEVKVERITALETEGGQSIPLEDITTGKSPSSQVAAKTALESLISAWSSYGTVKTEVQKTMMRELLVIDADVLSQPDMYSIHEGKGVAWYY